MRTLHSLGVYLLTYPELIRQFVSVLDLVFQGSEALLPILNYLLVTALISWGYIITLMLRTTMNFWILHRLLSCSRFSPVVVVQLHCENDAAVQLRPKLVREPRDDRKFDVWNAKDFIMPVQSVLRYRRLWASLQLSASYVASDQA